MTNLVLVLVVLAAGFGLRRLSDYQKQFPPVTGWLFGVPADLADGLTSFVIYVSLPSLIVVRVSKVQLSASHLVPMILPWVMLGLSVLLVLAAARFLHLDQRIRGLLLLLVPLGNTSFLGIPMVDAFFGTTGIQYAILYDQAGTFLALSTYGAVVTAFHSGGERKTGIRTILLKLVAFPPLIALILALGLRNVRIPEEVLAVLESFAGTLIPLVIAAVGFKIELRVRSTHLTPLGVGLTLKMVAAPLLALAVVRLFNLGGEAVAVSVFEAGMPPQVAAWAVAMKAGLEPELGAAMVGFGILLSFLTLPALYQLL